MSLEILNQLDAKIQQTVSKIRSLQQENFELKQKNQELELLKNQESEEVTHLRQQNEDLKQEQIMWQERISTLLNKIGEIAQ